MKMNEPLERLIHALKTEVEQSILPFWMYKTMDRTYGGFVGALDNNGTEVPSTKSGILNTRLLWTFSAAWRVLRDEKSLQMADYAMNTLKKAFIDPDYTGFYWSINQDGSIADDKKHIYTQAFGIYGLSEYFLASGNQEALDIAIALFKKMDGLAWKGPDTGYHEAYSRDWQPLDDARLGANDMVAERTFNTHLHLVEAYTNLYRAWPDAVLKKRLADLVDIHFTSMYDRQQKHILSYFDAELKPVSPLYSYGHDIEAAWLLFDAVLELKDESRITECKSLVIDIANQTMAEGVDPVHSGVYNLGEHGKPHDRNKQWWAQAEALSGFLYAYHLTGDKKYLHVSEKIWDFTYANVIDKVHGEWFYLVDESGKPFMDDGKAGPWKCPYHTSRTCLLFAAITTENPDGSPFSILNT